MYRLIVHILVVISLIVMNVSCSSKLKENKELTFATDTINRKYHLFNDTLLPCCNLNFVMEYPLDYYDPEALKKIQAIFVTSLFGARYTNQSPIEAISSYADAYIESYKELEKNTTRAEIEEGAMWMNYQQLSTSTTHYNAHQFYAYELSIYLFTGGAHGLNTTTFQTIDLTDMHQLSLSDLFEEMQLEPLTVLLREHLAKHAECANVSDLEDAGYLVNDVVPTENFFIDGKGVSWVYNPYEIAPYFMGATRLFIPYAELTSILRPESVVWRIINNTNL